MKSKIAAVGAMMTVFAIFEYLFYPRSVVPLELKALAIRLLPPAIGSFRRTERWMSNAGFQGLEVYASYRDGSAVETDVDIWLDAWEPHNSVDCWYVQGTPMFWQRLSSIRMTHTNAIFDTALFRDNHGLALLANTECYPAGCKESLLRGGLDLQLPVFSELMVTPVSILVRELNDPPAASQQGQGARLLQDFERFTAQLDLSLLLTRAVVHEVDGTKRGGANSP
jgi:hypothetical protein